MDIIRTPASSAGRSQIVSHGGLVYTVATANSDSSSITEQTRCALVYLDKHLLEGIPIKPAFSRQRYISKT